MEKLSFNYQEIARRYGLPEISPEEAQRLGEQGRVDSCNAVDGGDDGTGVQCDLCRNRGYIAVISDSGTFATQDCRCAGTRKTVKRLQKCGIWERAKRCTLDSFKTDTPTQKAMKSTVEQFIAVPDGHWLMICGQSGTGKTHLCTAAFVQLSYRYGMDGEYMLWNSDGRELKANSMDDDKGLRERYKTAEMLYIDDLFKGRKDQPPSDADIRLAFEILDYRYNNRLTTIVSSEMEFKNILKLDQAIAGRIKEMCGPYLMSIAPDPAKNYRLK